MVPVKDIYIEQMNACGQWFVRRSLIGRRGHRGAGGGWARPIAPARADPGMPAPDAEAGSIRRVTERSRGNRTVRQEARRGHGQSPGDR